MQALLNYETEMQKAFAKIEKDIENHMDVFKRLESELEAVKLFEQQDDKLIDEMRKHDSELYAAIRAAYEQEQFENNPDKHCQGMIAAVNAIYNLGYANGFKDGGKYARKED